MNYIKKLKSLGFKKIQPIVICNFNYDRGQYPLDKEYLYGYYIKTLEEVKNDEKYQKQGYHPISNKNQSYRLKISNSVSLFLILVGAEFTFVIKDDTIPNEKRTTFIYINSIKVPLKSEPLNDFFWKRCMDYISNNIKRDLLIKEIFKYG